MSFAIITDTSANISTPIAKAENLIVIPLSYYVGGEEKSCPDTEKFNSAAYYELLKNGEKITTSQINPQKYIEYMEPIVKDGQDILFIGMSSGISGSFSSSRIAREQLLKDYPERKICLVDSLAASMGEGMLVLKALKCRSEGMSLEETADFISKERLRLYQIFTVDDLMYLRRGGRLSNAVALVGTILHIKPVLKGDENGKIVTTGKVRGRKAVMQHIVDKFTQLAVKPESSEIAISHANCQEDAKTLLNLIKEKCNISDAFIVDHEPVTGSYLGPGALALYFFGDENVRLA